MRNLRLFTAALLAVPFWALAQTPEVQTTAQEEVLPQLPASETTPEQKIEARRDLQKSLQSAAVNNDPQERRKMLDAVATMEKTKIRRENLKKAPTEKVDYEKPVVNVNDRKDVQKYLQKTFADPLDASFVTPNQE